MTPNPLAGRPVVSDRPLRPVIARALELGRGPPVVVGWVAARRAAAPPEQVPDRRLVARLARDFVRRLWPADPGPANTLRRSFGTVPNGTA